ncbi:MAG: flagellar hook-length control protein FliK [Treponema sp.]|nr:flagellar hook-length control protein FliK [Treponema sp.]
MIQAISSQLAQTVAQRATEQTASGQQILVKAVVKNNKLGVFAKLIDGLISNSKQGPVGATPPAAAQAGITVLSVKTAQLATVARKTTAHTAGDVKAETVVKAGKMPTKAAKKIDEADHPTQKVSDTIAIAEQESGTLVEAKANMAKASDTIEKMSGTTAEIAIAEKAPMVFSDNANIAKESGTDVNLADTIAKEAAEAFSSVAKTKNEVSRGTLPHESAVLEDALVEHTQPDRNEVALISAANEVSHNKDLRYTSVKQNVSAEKLRVQSLFAGTTQAAKEEPDNAAKPADPRGKGRLELRDLRVRDTGVGVTSTAFTGADKTTTVSETGAQNIAEISLDLLPDGAKPFDTPVDTSEAQATRFENLLAHELSQRLNSDIVQQAQVLLRDGDAGTIKLSLKPENLGIVKVRLEMVENRITGQIIVESNEALRAFDREIQSLEQAFRDSGFSGVSLYTALASGSNQNTEENWQQQENAAFFSERLAVGQYEPKAHLVSGGRANELSTINMLA